MFEEKKVTQADAPITKLESLEANLIKEYLDHEGYQKRDLVKLSPEERRRVMVEACRYAAVRLAQIEARSKFLQKIEYP